MLIGAVVGLISDLKAVYELRDDVARVGDLAEGAQRYEDYTEAAILLSILASRLAEVRTAATDTSPADLLDAATKRVEKTFGLVGSQA